MVVLAVLAADTPLDSLGSLCLLWPSQQSEA